MSTALVPLAEGFEEIEGITVIDVLRRAGVEVVAASLTPGAVRGSRGTAHLADALLAEVIGRDYDAIALPGGRPGADHLAGCKPLLERLRQQVAAGKFVAAVCAGPMALDRAGVLGGRRFTCHPGAGQDIASGAPTGARVEVDGVIITGQAAGSAMEWALAIVSALCGEAKAAEVNAGLLARPE